MLKKQKCFTKEHVISTDFSEGEKEKRRKKVQDRLKTLSEEEKRKTHQYHHDWNKNLSEEEKQKKVDYKRNYYLSYKK